MKARSHAKGSAQIPSESLTILRAVAQRRQTFSRAICQRVCSLHTPMRSHVLPSHRLPTVAPSHQSAAHHRAVRVVTPTGQLPTIAIVSCHRPAIASVVSAACCRTVASAAELCAVPSSTERCVDCCVDAKCAHQHDNLRDTAHAGWKGSAEQVLR